MVKPQGIGEIEVSLNQNEFSPGGKLEGTFYLHLQKPVTARSLNVSFFGTLGEIGGPGLNEEYTVPMKISGNRIYSTYERHTFAIEIPKKLPLTKAYNYCLKIWLDIPAQLDLVKITEIKIANARAPPASRASLQVPAIFIVGAFFIVFAYLLSDISVQTLAVLLPGLFVVWLTYQFYFARRIPKRT